MRSPVFEYTDGIYRRQVGTRQHVSALVSRESPPIQCTPMSPSRRIRLLRAPVARKLVRSALGLRFAYCSTRSCATASSSSYPSATVVGAERAGGNDTELGGGEEIELSASSPLAPISVLGLTAAVTATCPTKNM